MGDWEHEYTWAIDQVKFHHGKKSAYILYAIKQLEIGLFPKEKISAKLKKDLDGIADPDYIQKICSSVGATDINKARSDTLVDNSDGTVSLKRNSGGRPDSDDDTPTRKKTPEEIERETFELENKPYIIHIQNLVDFYNDVIAKLKSKHFLSIIMKDPVAMKSYEENIHVAEGTIKFAKQAWDDRNIVPIQTQFKLHALVAVSTIKHGAKMYLGWLKEYSKISSKQATKILLGKTRDVNQEYEPLEETEARESGFLGEPCPKCNSFRVKLEFGWAKCYACENEWERPSTRLGQFKQEQEYIDEDDSDSS